ncbi:MAG: DMT family transporter [Gammaproteobacteria bacterium]
MNRLPSSIEAPSWLPLAALVCGGIALGLGGLFVRLADTGPVSTAFWRLLLALPFMMLLARLNDPSPADIPRRSLAIVALGGIAFAIDLSLWHVGVGMTRLANATLFGNGASLVLMVWGFVVARTFPARLEWVAMLLAIGGAAILMGRSLEVSATTLLGDLFSLGAGLVYACYLLMLRSARQQVGPWTMLVLVSVAACPFLLLVAVGLGESVWPRDWTPLVCLAFVSQILGQGLLVFAMRHFSAMVLGMALLIQPAVAALSGVWFLGERLAIADLVGILLVASALAMAAGRQVGPRR